MKSKFAIALAATFLAAALAVITTRGSAPKPSATAKPSHTRTERPKKVRTHAVIEDAPAAAALDQDYAMLGMQSETEETANLTGWRQRYDALVSENGDTQLAVAALRAEIDQVFSQWVTEKIEPITSLPPAERYDQLALIRESVSEGAAAIFEALGLEGGYHVATAANALDIVSAEIQYAETAPDSTSRLALLHLDRERQGRLDHAVALEDETKRAAAMDELETWYSEGLAKVFPDDQITFE